MRPKREGDRAIVSRKRAPEAARKRQDRGSHHRWASAIATSARTVPCATTLRAEQAAYRGPAQRWGVTTCQARAARNRVGGDSPVKRQCFRIAPKALLQRITAPSSPLRLFAVTNCHRRPFIHLLEFCTTHSNSVS